MLSSNSSPVRKLFLRSFLVLIHGAVRTNSNTYPAGPGQTAQPPSCIKQLTDNCGVRSGSFPYSRHTRAILRFPSIQWGIRLLRGILAVQSVGSSCTQLPDGLRGKAAGLLRALPPGLLQLTHKASIIRGGYGEL